ncbi:MAG: bifunctional hydroxymethylpyrimidine kinase/phosphomethylpyrimidine kinase, partial [Candidatus Nealsonbacteria bacterium]|nr:bifunctional hydroxymethylpyrimidine kinase/phosphomethylpyrimidine kinase [Candidatus Nealsonbacteria bacterium]
AARAADAPVTFIAATGDDAFGRDTMDHLRGENLDLRFVKTVADQPTGVALILVDRYGENLISVASGANLSLTPADVDAVPEDVFRSAAIFLACLESPLETVARGLARAKQAGLTTILNPAPANAAICGNGLLSLVDVITPNEGEAAALVGGEAAALAGGDAGQQPDATARARRLQQLGCRSCVITLGAAGCLVVEQDATLVEGHCVEAVDTTAAGDAFNGALAVALAEGRPLAEAARWANRAAAIAVTRTGAQPSLPSRAEIDA